MKQQVAFTLLALSRWLLVPELSSASSAMLLASGDQDESSQREESEGSSKQQEGSWSHWWSYDGISGPDYWNINKRWRLCSLGKKQSPIDVRTDRLVYDHLLGPLHLNWMPAGATNYDAALSAAEDDDQQAKKSRRQRNADDDDSQKAVKVQLLNSGRGLEVWLEPGLGGPKRRAPSAELHQQDQLIVSHGPLSYSYKLFKIELHSAAPTFGDRSQPHTFAPGSAPGIRAKSSEHLIDGRAFDAELQLHFYNKHLAASAVDAQQLANEDSRPNLFATIGVFLLATHQHQTINLKGQLKFQKRNLTNSAIDFILNNLSALQNESDSMELNLERRHLESLITTRRHYVTYQGSLNRPPCAESVDWILLNKALQVDADKFLMLFERLNTNQENIRPVKPLNRRLLRTTINNLAEDHLSGADYDDNNARLDEIELAKVAGDQTLAPACSLSGTSKSCSNDTLGRVNSGSDKQAQPEGQSLRASGGVKLAAKSCSMRPNYAYQLTNFHNSKLLAS